jgi:hypothetical protein
MSDTDPARNDRGDGLTQVFLSDLPAMAGIVTIVTQPFAQESLRAVVGLPAWAPFAIAFGVSGLLAFYKLLVVRRSGTRECALCVPIVMLVVFAAYATGNNVVYYAKEGLTQPISSEQATALKRERDLLEAQLKNAEELIDTMRRALGVAEPGSGRPSSSAPAPSWWARLFQPTEAAAQDRRPPPPPRDRMRTPAADAQRLRQELRKYDIEQRQLKERLETIRPDPTRPAAQQQQQPLIKSW